MDTQIRNKLIATDTAYCNTPDADDASTSAKNIVGTTDVHDMKIDKYFLSKLGNNIRQKKAMNKLIRDRSQVEISNKIKDLLRTLFIDDW